MPTYLIGLIILLTRQGGDFIASRYGLARSVWLDYSGIFSE